MDNHTQIGTFRVHNFLYCLFRKCRKQLFQLEESLHEEVFLLLLHLFRCLMIYKNFPFISLYEIIDFTYRTGIDSVYPVFIPVTFTIVSMCLTLLLSSVEVPPSSVNK